MSITATTRQPTRPCAIPCSPYAHSYVVTKRLQFQNEYLGTDLCPPFGRSHTPNLHVTSTRMCASQMNALMSTRGKHCISARYTIVSRGKCRKKDRCKKYTLSEEVYRVPGAMFYTLRLTPYVHSTNVHNAYTRATIAPLTTEKQLMTDKFGSMRLTRFIVPCETGVMRLEWAHSNK